MRFRSLLRVGLFAALIPAAFGDTVVQQGTFDWYADDGGQILLTVTVSSKVDGYPGLYVWDYQIENISFNGNYLGGIRPELPVLI